METLKINGIEKRFGQLPPTVDKLLEHLDIEAATVVAELDGCIVERKNFASTHLKPGQTIELVRFVPGG
jgi:thiamine biosynthesis protein ThiS